jgi:hypothetical protein
LEGAGNHLTRQILPYWSQNKHLQMRFDVRPAQGGDPEGMRQGVNIWGEVYDTRHLSPLMAHRCRSSMSASESAIGGKADKICSL